MIGPDGIGRPSHRVRSRGAGKGARVNNPGVMPGLLAA